jgi:hypothetical protein
MLSLQMVAVGFKVPITNLAKQANSTEVFYKVSKVGFLGIYKTWLMLIILGVPFN